MVSSRRCSVWMRRKLIQRSNPLLQGNAESVRRGDEDVIGGWWRRGELKATWPGACGLVACVGLPDVEELAVAGGGDGEPLLGGGAAEGGADVFLAVGELRQGDFVVI